MTPVLWLRAALRNIEAIFAYYAEHCARREAKRLIAHIHKCTEQLSQLPELGRPGRVAHTRELVVPKSPFVVIYRLKNTRVELLRVLHSAQRWPRSN